MKNIFSVIFSLILLGGFLYAQKMNIHTSNGTDIYNLADIDSITFDVTTTVTDIDGNTYNTVRVGNQLWMAENLKVTHYRNGDAIPNITNGSDWNFLTSGAFCSYDNEYANTGIYGLLYNWYAIDDIRNIAPDGWHIPTNEEWKELEMYLGMSENEANNSGWRGTNEGGKLKEIGTTHWSSPNTGATNSSGFKALPAGSRGSSGTFSFKTKSARFWSSGTDNSGNAYGRVLDYDASAIFLNYGINYKKDGLSVRCIKD